jgi:hypothetical protein
VISVRAAAGLIGRDAAEHRRLRYRRTTVAVAC